MTGKRDANISGKVILEEAESQGFADSFTEFSVHGNCRVGRVRRYDRFYFVKALRADLRDDPSLRRQLRKEFDIMLKAEHHGIVRAIDFFYSEELGDAILMEYVPGLDLRQWLEEKPSRKERRRVARQLLEAAAYMHRRGMVHRDLKPENILITGEGNSVKIIDFGLADTADSAVLKRAAGNAGYSAAEQQEGADAHPTADVYSLSLLIRQLRPGPEWLIAAKKGSDPRPEKRYADAGRMLRAVGAIVRLLKTGAAAATVVIMALIAMFSYSGSDQSDSVKMLPLDHPQTTADSMAGANRNGVVNNESSAADSSSSGEPDIGVPQLVGADNMPLPTGDVSTGPSVASPSPAPVPEPKSASAPAEGNRNNIADEKSRKDPARNHSIFHSSLSGMELPNHDYFCDRSKDLLKDMRKLPGYGKHTPREVAEAYRRDFEKCKERLREENVAPRNDDAFGIMWEFYLGGFAGAWPDDRNAYHEYLKLIIHVDVQVRSCFVNANP